MSKRALIRSVFGLVCLFMVGPAFGETIDEVEKKLTEALAKHKTIQSKTHSKQRIKTEQMEMSSETISTSEWKRKDDKVSLSRSESKTKSTQKVMDQPEEKTETEVLAIDDGKFMYVLSSTANQKTAMKMVRAVNSLAGKQYFAWLREHFDLKLLPDEKVEGKEVYVIEATPKAADPMTFKTIYYMDKKSGLTVKSVTFDKDAKPVIETLTTGVKLDAEISDDRFVFKAPEGVTVVDMTTQENASAQSQPEAEKEPAAEPKDEPKEQKKEKKKGLGGLFDKLK